MPIRLKPRFRLTPASPTVKRVRSPKMPQRLGDRATSDFIHNCVTCSRWVSCLDNQRSVGYRCTRYREATTDIQSLEELLDTSVFDTDQSVADENIFNEASGSEVDIQAMIEAVINSNVPVPPDLRINDSDIPEAANFNEWATSAKFAGAGMPPFPRQLEIGTKLLGEFCPRCSDNDWFDEMRVDASLAEIHDRVTFLKHGKCPECKITKSELVLSNELLDYSEFIAVMGQRCLTGDMIIPTNRGFIPIGDMVYKSYKEGFNKFKGFEGRSRDTRPDTRLLLPSSPTYGKNLITLENGSFATPSDFYISKPSTTIKITTKHGFSVEGTADHPVMTEKGWVKLKDISKSDNLLIQGGQNIWSKRDYVTPDVGRLCGFVISEGYTTISPNGHPNRLRIYNKDLDIINFCESTFSNGGVEVSKYIPEDGRTPYIEVASIDTCKGLEKLFGDFNHRSGDREIPEKIMRSGKTVMTAFLSALFEGDGYISKLGHVSYCSKSPKLVHQMQVVLLNYGILASRYSFTSSATNGLPRNSGTYYGISLKGHQSLETFFKEIGFISKRKNSRQKVVFDRKMPYTVDKLTTLQQTEYLKLLTEDQVGRLFSMRNTLSKSRYFLPVVSKVKSKTKKVTYDFTIPESHRFMSNGLLSHNSGKTTSVNLWEGYNLHKFLKLSNPASVYGLLPSQILISTPTALTFAQAVTNVWNPFSNILTESPWFIFLHEFLEQKGYELGEQLYDLGKHSMRYRYRNLFIAPSGPSKRTLRGATRFSACLVGDSLISVPNGHRKIEDMVPGDHIVLGKEKLKVKNVFYNGVKPTIIVKTKHGHRTQLTKDHMMPVSINKDGTFNKIKIGDMKVGDRLIVELKTAPLSTAPKNMIDNLLTFTTITSIEKGKNRKVYDMEIDDFRHVYSAQGILAGNSLDEAGWFPLSRKDGKDMERMDGAGVHAALKNSLFTVRAAYNRRIEEGYSNIPKPLLFMMSSPSAYNDFIMSSYRKAHGSKIIYARKLETWNFNPTLKKEDFSEEFRSNPVVAERDFACNPPIGVGLFLNDMDVVGRCFSNRKNGLYVQTSLSLSKSKQKVTTAQAVMRTAYRPQNATILSVDVGLVNNSFAIAVIGVPDDYDPETWDHEDSGTQLNPVEVFALGEIMPKGGSRISMHSLYHKVLVPLIEEFNCIMFVSDRWQNASIASSLEAEHEVEPVEWRATWEDFETTRELLYSGQMTLPKLDSPVQDIMETTLDNYPECFRIHATDHLAWQFATVKEQTNVTVLKGDGGTDDLFRTVVLGAALLQDEDILEELLDYNVEDQPEEKPTLGMVRRAGSSNKMSGSSSPGKAAVGLVTKYKPGT